MTQEYYFAVPGREDENEPVLIFLHRHIISLFIPMGIFILLTLLPVLFKIVIAQDTFASSISLNARLLITIFVSMYYLMLVGYLFGEWISYYYDILIVTKSTVIDIKQNNLFNREITHLHLRQVEDISSEIKGFLPTVFNYGNIIVQSAGAQEHTVIQAIPNPQKVAAIILQLHKDFIEYELSSHRGETDSDEEKDSTDK